VGWIGIAAGHKDKKSACRKRPSIARTFTLNERPVSVRQKALGNDRNVVGNGHAAFGVKTQKHEIQRAFSETLK
jgi:hypothetical protein